MDGLQRVLRVAPQLLIHVHKVVYVEVRVSRQCRLVEDLKGGWQLKGCHAYLSLHLGGSSITARRRDPVVAVRLAFVRIQSPLPPACVHCHIRCKAPSPLPLNVHIVTKDATSCPPACLHRKTGRGHAPFCAHRKTR
eukprot:354734-Chlamydomonas_euryale.AAC.14